MLKLKCALKGPYNPATLVASNSLTFFNIVYKLSYLPLTPNCYVRMEIGKQKGYSIICSPVARILKLRYPTISTALGC